MLATMNICAAQEEKHRHPCGLSSSFAAARCEQARSRVDSSLWKTAQRTYFFIVWDILTKSAEHDIMAV